MSTWLPLAAFTQKKPESSRSQFCNRKHEIKHSKFQLSTSILSVYIILICLSRLYIIVKQSCVFFFNFSFINERVQTLSRDGHSLLIIRFDKSQR